MRAMHVIFLSLLFSLCLVACSEGADPNGDPWGGDELLPAYQRIGPPEYTLTLESPAGDLPRLYLEDVQAAYPEVDWSTLDRLYIPAGHYGSIYLGNLPSRTPERPLIITNLGGQVLIGGGGFGYTLNLQGGANWVLTGRHDEALAIGDAGFPGHATGSLAHTRGTYGITIDDEFSREGLSGIYVGSGATEFEIEFVEITRTEFAGISAKTDDNGAATMRNVQLHDVYIHDTGGEGIYFGSTQSQPQHTFVNLRIFDSRFLRTGLEALQVGQLGDGCEIHHNVIGPGALRWRSAFADYQNGNVQYGQRYGSSSFHHNVVVGTGDLFVEFFPQAVSGDPHGEADTVTFSDNYFADTSLTGVYTHKEANDVTVIFENNHLRGIDFTYDQVYPATEAPIAVFGVGSNTLNPHLLRDNLFEAPYPFIMWVFDSVTEERNTATTVPPIAFADFINDEIEANFRRLEWWTAVATRHPDQPAMVYPAGSYVMHLGTLYRALAESSGAPPDASPQEWEALPPPADDVAVTSQGAYATMGIRLGQ